MSGAEPAAVLVEGVVEDVVQASTIQWPRGEPAFREEPRSPHGRIESRAVWTTTTLNGY